MRPTDPAAERMLGVVLRLESASWPGALPAYSANLLALSARCERPAAKGEIYRWFMREGGGALVVRHDERREDLRDAFHEMVAKVPGILLRFRSGLDPDRRPNLKSMLVRWIGWRANELYASRQRHASRRAPYRLSDQVAPGGPDVAAELGEVLALLDGADPVVRALRLVGLGHTIAGAARLTGASRQQIYRARSALRKKVEQEPDSD